MSEYSFPSQATKPVPPTREMLQQRRLQEMLENAKGGASPKSLVLAAEAEQAFQGDASPIPHLAGTTFNFEEAVKNEASKRQQQ